MGHPALIIRPFLADHTPLLRLSRRRRGDGDGKPCQEDIHPSPEAVAPPSQGRPGWEVPCRHHRPKGRAMFMLMLRCGLRVEEVSRLTMDAVELPRMRLFVANGKGRKDRAVYVSNDARSALDAYLKKRSSKAKQLFLVQKGPPTGTPLSVRGIQKRIEYYSRQSRSRSRVTAFVIPWPLSFSMPMPTSPLSRTSWDMPTLPRPRGTAEYRILRSRETTIMRLSW
jgi:integrase